MKLFIVITLLLLVSLSSANQKAVTDAGTEIILYEDGTWKYSDAATDSPDTILMNKNNFAIHDESTFSLQSANNNSAVWLNENKWSFKKLPKDSGTEYEFELKSGGLIGLLGTETKEVPLESIPEGVLINLRSKSSNVSVIKKEYRIVNNYKVIYMETSLTNKDENYVMFGYYYSDNSGTTQLCAFVKSNLVKEHRSEINDFLNGLTAR